MQRIFKSFTISVRFIETDVTKLNRYKSLYYFQYYPKSSDVLLVHNSSFSYFSFFFVSENGFVFLEVERTLIDINIKNREEYEREIREWKMKCWT